MKKPTSNADMTATTAHLIQTAGHEIGHVVTHIAQAKKSKSKKAIKFNLDHASKHTGGVQDHIQRVIDHLHNNYPGISKKMKELEQATPQPEGGLKGLMK